MVSFMVATEHIEAKTSLKENHVKIFSVKRLCNLCCLSMEIEIFFFLLCRANVLFSNWHFRSADVLSNIATLMLYKPAKLRYKHFYIKTFCSVFCYICCVNAKRAHGEAATGNETA